MDRTVGIGQMMKNSEWLAAGTVGIYGFMNFLSPLLSPYFLQQVHTENLQFMQNRDVYNVDYFRFVLSLASCNAVSYT